MLKIPARLVILLTVRILISFYCSCTCFFIIRVCKVIKLRDDKRVEKWWEEVMLYTLNALTNREWLWFGHIPTLTSRKKVEIPFTPGHCQGNVIYIDHFLTSQILSTFKSTSIFSRPVQKIPPIYYHFTQIISAKKFSFKLEIDVNSKPLKHLLKIVAAECRHLHFYE